MVIGESMKNTEPWYGVRLIYHHKNDLCNAYEEQIVIVRAESFAEAIEQAEILAEEYQSETTVYTGHAMCFHIFDKSEERLSHGTEVFSLIRKSDLEPSEYINRYYDTGTECAGEFE